MHPDLVEGWVFCRRAFGLDPEQRSAFWPSADDEAFFARLCAAHDALVLPIPFNVYLNEDEILDVLPGLGAQDSARCPVDVVCT